LQIGSVFTPWPSWLIAAHPSTDRAPTDDLNRFLEALSKYVNRFKAADNLNASLEFLKDKFKYQAEEDIKVRSVLSMYVTTDLDLFIMTCRRGWTLCNIPKIALRFQVR
jgi:hypothetical protein